MSKSSNTLIDRPDVAVVEDENHVVSYRSGAVVYEESFQNGRLTGRGWNGAGYLSTYDGRVDPNAYPGANSFWLEIDGQLLGSDWEWDGLETLADHQPIPAMPRPFALHTVVTLSNRLRPIAVKVHTGLDGTPILVRWLEVTNTGSAPAAIGAAFTWSGIIKHQARWREHLQDGKPLYSLGYMANDHSCNEGDFRWFDLPNVRYCVDGRATRDRHRHPMFVLRNNATGEHHIGQLAWSGGYTFEFNLDSPPATSDSKASLSFRSGLNGPAPQAVLAPGETINLPEMHLGLTYGGLDEAVQAMHDHIRQSVLMPQARNRGNWVEASIGPEVEITAENTMQCIESAGGFGAELFFIDASWYAAPHSFWSTTVGDWDVDLDRFPGGLAPFRNRAHELGMLFGLWMEAERVGPKSKIATQHPDWILRDFNGADMEGVLDLSNPHAAEWMEAQIARVIGENDLDFFRLDYNMRGMGKVSSGAYVEGHYFRYYEALYAIYDRLRARFPNVVFESCASGGGRTDLGMMRRFCHTWVTDWQIAPRSFSITNGMTIALPPEIVDRLIFGQTGHIAGDFDFQVRQLLFVRPTIGPMFGQLGLDENPTLRKKLKEAVSFYKSFVRPFSLDSRIYHHTPVAAGPEPKGWGVLELASRNRTRGICGLFQLSSPDQPEYVLRPRGLDPSRKYTVTLSNSGASYQIDGATLLAQGLVVRLEGALTSELVVYEAL
ncbi:MAG: alpha-galactosidase [Capsulimonadaceae bacterium]|nr:alpha-galactosidase [Capsulimonadaceae bacterium]